MPPRPPLIIDKNDSTKSLETIETRPGVRQSFVHLQPIDPNADTLIIFPGGSGRGQVFEKNALIGTRGSFVARSIDLWQRKYRIIVIDTPSDHAGGMTETFRRMTNHRLDISMLMDAITKRWPTHFILLGTSLSTISAFNIGAAGDPRIKAVILTSTHVNYLEQTAIESIRVPVLLVSHKDDGCPLTKPIQSQKFRDILARNIKADYIEISGGSQKDSPCEAYSHHGFNGVEAETIAAIQNWILEISKSK